MTTYIVSILLLLAILCAWLALRKIACDFSAAHPEFGAHREEGQGCGGCPEEGCAGRCHE